MDLLTKQIISYMFILYTNQISFGRPLNHGLTVKLNKSLPNEDSRQKVIGKLFTKVSDAPMLTDSSEKMTVTTPHTDNIKESIKIFKNFLNAPLNSLNQFEQYNVVVATAPYHVRISGKQVKPLFVYIVFPAEDDSQLNIPQIYFVHKSSKIEDVIQRPSKLEPLLIVDSNRTVTGIKSNEVAKYVKFKNKLTNKRNYQIR